jgi:N-formylglutamate amidohydrolase
MTDHFTDEFFQLDSSNAIPVVHPVSRLVVDPERFLDDGLESMAQYGMGAVYTRTSEGKRMRREGKTPERKRLIADYYFPHHQTLTAAIREALEQWGSCLVVDCHSFASAPLPHESDQAPDRPDVCVGTDEFHSPKNLVTLAVELFEKAGFRTLLNRPFSGALVPEAFHRRESRVRAIMVEINRSLYMCEASGERLACFPALKLRLHEVLTKLVTTLK